MPIHVNMLVVMVFSPIEKFQVYFDIITLVGMWIEPFKYIMQPHKNIERGWGEANMKHDWCKEDKLQSSIHCFNVSPNRRRDLECGVCNPLQVKCWQCQVFVWKVGPSFTFRSWVVFYLLTPLSDWPIIMIDPGGFLLLVPNLFRHPISFLWVGLQKCK
jgi:hypothetical protein